MRLGTIIDIKTLAVKCQITVHTNNKQKIEKNEKNSIPDFCSSAFCSTGH